MIKRICQQRDAIKYTMLIRGVIEEGRIHRFYRGSQRCPNQCLVLNQEIKFHFLNKAVEL